MRFSRSISLMALVLMGLLLADKVSKIVHDWRWSQRFSLSEEVQTARGYCATLTGIPTEELKVAGVAGSSSLWGEVATVQFLERKSAAPQHMTVKLQRPIGCGWQVTNFNLTPTEGRSRRDL